MVQDNYTIKNRKGKHLNEIERAQIVAYIKSGQIMKYIANTLGRCPKIIKRELKRGKVTGLLKQLMNPILTKLVKRCIINNKQIKKEIPNQK